MSLRRPITLALLALVLPACSALTPADSAPTSSASSSAGDGEATPPAAPPAGATSAPPASPAAPAAERPAPDAAAVPLVQSQDHDAVGALHAQGAPHQIADWQVQMDSYVPDATAEVLAGNEFAPPPTRGAYAKATWTVTYTGTGEGIAYADLSTDVMGADSVQYPDDTCTTYLIRDGLWVTLVLNPGGSITFSTCYDGPPEALAGATAVRAGTVLRQDRVDWSTRP